MTRIRGPRRRLAGSFLTFSNEAPLKSLISRGVRRNAGQPESSPRAPTRTFELYRVRVVRLVNYSYLVKWNRIQCSM